MEEPRSLAQPARPARDGARAERAAARSRGTALKRRRQEVRWAPSTLTAAGLGMAPGERDPGLLSAATPEAPRGVAGRRAALPAPGEAVDFDREGL